MFATLLRFPGGSDSKKSACNVGDLHSIPGSGTSLGEGNGNPLQCSCLENSTNRGYSRWGRKESDTTEQLIQSLSTFFYTPTTQCVKKKKAFFLLEFFLFVELLPQSVMESESPMFEFWLS